MRLHFFIIFLLILCICFLAWLVFGRRILRRVDRVSLVLDSDLSITPLEIRQDAFVIGLRNWPFPRTKAGPIEICADSQNRLTLISSGSRFTLGPVIQRRMANNNGIRLDFTIQPDAGDVVSMTQSHSRLFWIRPFAFSIMGGRISRRRRHLYDHLRWKKASGQTLQIIWRHEQWHYKSSGWADQCDLRLIVVRAGVNPSEKILVRYLLRTKGWTRGEYRLEDCPSEGSNEVFRVIHASDEAAAHPGAGLSITVQVDRESAKVIRELSGQ